MIDKRKVEVARLEKNNINVLNSYAVTTILVDSFKSNPLVNTVILELLIRDLNKADIFPLVHIMPGTFELVENRLEIVFDIAVVSMRQTQVQH
jgi:hypothetical protein